MTNLLQAGILDRQIVQQNFFCYLISALLCLFISCDSPEEKPSGFDLSKRSSELRGELLDPEYECQKHFYRPYMTAGGSGGKVEKGQSFEEYKNSNPNRPDEKKDKIYILLIGDFDKKQLLVLEQTIEYMESCFSLPVKKLASYPLKRIADTAKRESPQLGHQQLNATHIIRDVLLPNRPEDAVALIGFTASDLYPSEKMNYVFGLASLTNRIGIWSIFRNGNPNANETMFKQCMKRTISTAIHETGHIFGIRHCIAYECVMSQRDSMIQKDLRGLNFCPSCQQKLNWSMKFDPAKRFRNLMALCSSIGLKQEADFFLKSLELLRENRVKK